MGIIVQGVVSRGKGRAGPDHRGAGARAGPRGRRSSASRRAASATLTCTTRWAASATTTRTCSGHEAAGVVEAVGDDVTDVAPGDFVILNWRAVCGQCRACKRGPPVVLLRHAQTRIQKMTLADGTPLSARARHRRVSRRRRWSRRASAPRVNPAIAPRDRGAARLRRDGRHRRRDQQPAASPAADTVRRDRLRRRRRTRRCSAAGWPAPRRSSRWDIDDRKLEWGARVRRHPHDQLAYRGRG